MPETEPTVKAKDALASKERLAFNTDMVGLQIRLLMGGEVLDHKKPIPTDEDEIRKRVQNLETRALTSYKLLSKLSTHERITYWDNREKKDESLKQKGAKKSTWLRETLDAYNNPDDNSYREVFGKYQIGDINWKQFNEAEAEKFYQRYFQDTSLKPITLDGKTLYIPSSVAEYAKDIATQYVTERQSDNGEKAYSINFEQLQKDLPTIQAWSNNFGDQHSYEILAQLIDAETKNVLKEKQDEQIKAVLQKEKVDDKEIARGDNLRKREIYHLEALQQAGAYKEIETPTPQPSPPPESRPPAEPEDIEEYDKSKPIPARFKWIYEKAFNPLTDQPDKLRKFPEEHLVEEMVRPAAIAHKLKLQDRKHGLHRYDHLTEAQLAKQIENENEVLRGQLSKLGLDQIHMAEILNSAMADYKKFVEEKYKIKLPNIGEISILPITGKTAEYYHPNGGALAFVTPTVPAIFLNMDNIAKEALNLTHKPWQELSGEEFRTLIIRLLNEIRPHETSHLSSDLAFWYLDKVSNKDKHKKVAMGKLGLFMAKPIGLTEENDIITKQRGRGLMEAVTVELTHQWGKSLNPPQNLDIDAYKNERQVLTALSDLFQKEQGISYDEALNKFVQAYFTPDGFSHLAQELSGRKYEKGPDGTVHKKGEITRPHYLEIIYALMEYADRFAPPAGLPHYHLALSYIHDTLTDNQKKAILALIKMEEGTEKAGQISFLTLPKTTRDYLRAKLTSTPIPKPKTPPSSIVSKPQEPPAKTVEPAKPAEPPKAVEPPKQVAIEPKNIEELIEKSIAALQKAEETKFVMDEKAAATLIPLLLPAIVKRIKDSSWKAKMFNLNLGVESQTDLKITPSEASGTITVKVSASAMHIDPVKIDYKLQNASSGHVVFSEMKTEPEEVAGFNIQEKVKDEIAKSTFDGYVLAFIKQEVQKKNKDLEITDVSLQFTPDNKLAISVKGKSKKKT